MDRSSIASEKCQHRLVRSFNHLKRGLISGVEIGCVGLVSRVYMELSSEVEVLSQEGLMSTSEDCAGANHSLW